MNKPKIGDIYYFDNSVAKNWGWSPKSNFYRILSLNSSNKEYNIIIAEVNKNTGNWLVNEDFLDKNFIKNKVATILYGRK